MIEKNNCRRLSCLGVKVLLILLMSLFGCLFNTNTSRAAEEETSSYPAPTNFKLDYGSDPTDVNQFVWNFSWAPVEDERVIGYCLNIYADDINYGREVSFDSDVTKLPKDTDSTVNAEYAADYIKNGYKYAAVRAKYSDGYSEYSDPVSLQSFETYNLANKPYDSADKITDKINEVLSSRPDTSEERWYYLFVRKDVFEAYDLNEAIFSMGSNQMACAKDGGDYARLEGVISGDISLNEAENKTYAAETYKTYTIYANGWPYYYDMEDNGYILCVLKDTRSYSTTVEEEKKLSADLNALCTTGELAKCRTMSTGEKIRTCLKWAEQHVNSTLPDDDPVYSTAYSAFENGIGDGTGYSLLCYRLLREFDIPVRVVGSGRNLIYIDGAWYAGTLLENGSLEGVTDTGYVTDEAENDSEAFTTNILNHVSESDYQIKVNVNAPTGFTIKYSKTGNVDTFTWTFSWNPVKGATGYYVVLYGSDPEDDEILYAEGTKTSLSVSGSYITFYRGAVRSKSDLPGCNKAAVVAVMDEYKSARSASVTLMSFTEYQAKNNLYTKAMITKLIQSDLASRSGNYVAKTHYLFVPKSVYNNYSVAEEVFSIGTNQLSCAKDGGDYARIEAYMQGAISLEKVGSYKGTDGSNYLISDYEIPDNVVMCVLKVTPFYTTTVKQEKALSKAITALCTTGELAKCKKMSTLNKVLTCQKWVEKHVTYSKKGNTDQYYLTAHAAYYKKASDCRGYALLFYRLLREFNIPVRVVETGSHIWNLVYVDNFWYICDASKENGTFLKGSNSVSMKKVVNYDFYLPGKSAGFAKIIKSVSKTNHPLSGSYSKKMKATIKLSKTSVTLKRKKTVTIKVSKLIKGDCVISWKSGSNKIATVSSKGVIKGIKKGNVTVTVTLKSGLKAKVKVKVT